jgi:hypothetical protein
MKSSIFKFLVLLAPVLASAESIDSKGKMYIPQERLTLHNNKIYAQIHNEWHQVNALRSDEKGVYVDEKDLPLGLWVCDHCGMGNAIWDAVCRRCQQPR